MKSFIYLNVYELLLLEREDEFNFLSQWKFSIRDSTLENDMWSAQRKFDGQFKSKSTFLIQSRKFSG